MVIQKLKVKKSDMNNSYGEEWARNSKNCSKINVHKIHLTQLIFMQEQRQIVKYQMVFMLTHPFTALWCQIRHNLYLKLLKYKLCLQFVIYVTIAIVIKYNMIITTKT